MGTSLSLSLFVTKTNSTFARYDPVCLKTYDSDENQDEKSSMVSIDATDMNNNNDNIETAIDNA